MYPDSFLDTPVSLLLLIITLASSLLAFSRPEIRAKLLFNPYAVIHRKEYYRIGGHALIHADFMHLFFNMYVFFEFGRILEWVITNEEVFSVVLPGEEFWGVNMGRFLFLTLYSGGVVFASIPALRKHSDNPSYNSLGASGAVSAVLLGYILIFPAAELRLLIFPFFGIPAFVMGILFFWYESYMNKNRRTNIAHDAHLYGAAFGLLFMILIQPAFISRFYSEVAAYVLRLIG